MIILSKQKIKSAYSDLQELVQKGYVRFVTPSEQQEVSQFVTNFYITGDIVNYLPITQYDSTQDRDNVLKEHFDKLAGMLDLIDTMKNIIIGLVGLIILGLNSISLIKEPQYFIMNIIATTVLSFILVWFRKKIFGFLISRLVKLIF